MAVTSVRVLVTGASGAIGTPADTYTNAATAYVASRLSPIPTWRTPSLGI